MLTKKQAERLEGVWSEGSLRSIDLGNAARALLDTVSAQVAPYRPIASAETKRWVGRAEKSMLEWDRASPDDDDLLGEILDDMVDLIEDAIAPAGFSYGPQEGDCACYVVWQAEPAPEDEFDGDETTAPK